MAARMDKEEDGSVFVRLQIAITDPVAIEKVKDKRYLTGSVGGRAGKAVCSISGEDLARVSESGRAPVSRYKRGQVYKGKLAYVDMQDISFKEYSFVNQPADSKSSIRGIRSGDDKSIGTSDSEWVAKSSAFVLYMDKEDIVSVEENQSILTSMKKKESKPLYLHLKGAFLSAYAIQESENYKYEDSSLLSNKSEKDDIYQENSNMKNDAQQDDVLAAVEGLSEDLSAIAASISEEVSEEVSQENDKEEAPEQEAPEEETPEADDVKVEDADKEEVEESALEETSIKEADMTSAAAAVQKVVNEAVVLGIAAQRAHWNVVGVDFQQYHALFGAIYSDIFDSLDDIAEEIRKMDVMVENLTSMVMNAGFKDDATLADARELTADLLRKNEMLNETILAAFTACDAVNAQGTADLMAARDGMHKKWSWQLRSSLGMDAGEPADESWREIGSTSSLTEEENEEANNSTAELTSNDSASEQKAEELNEKVQLLQEENAKLKNALHRTLAERVVDTKIATGVESHQDREDLIEEHAKRSASSLADSLRDLARMPVVKTSKVAMPEMSSDVNAIEGEDNVFTLDAEEVKEEEDVRTPEQIFVDALMGRRKL
jgi:starvation-inducible DNA-binding protein